MTLAVEIALVRAYLIITLNTLLEGEREEKNRIMSNYNALIVSPWDNINILLYVVKDCSFVSMNLHTVPNALKKISGNLFPCILKPFNECTPESFGELIYTCKMIQPGIFYRFSQPVHFSRFKPDNLLLSTARFPGLNLEKCTGWLNLEKTPRLDYFTGID